MFLLTLAILDVRYVLEPLPLGIALGLVIGKLVGVFGYLLLRFTKAPAARM